MKTFIAIQLSLGVVPVDLQRKSTVFGNEVEFRWRRYHNSRHDQIKVSYNVPDAEFKKCQTLLKIASTRQKRYLPKEK